MGAEMPTPRERLETKMANRGRRCKVCVWLDTLSPKSRSLWEDAINDPRFSPAAIATEITVDGGDIGRDAVVRHREKGQH